MDTLGLLAAGGLVGWVVGYTASAQGWSQEKVTFSLLPFALGAFVCLTFF